MGYPIHIAVAIFLLSLSACGSTHKNKISEKTRDNTMNPDTIPEIPPPLKPGPGPGSVQLKGKVLSSKRAENDSSFIFKIRVINVLGMGAATPAVGTGTILQILSTGRSKKIQQGSIIVCTIQHQQIVKNNDYSAHPRYWLLMQLKQIFDSK